MTTQQLYQKVINEQMSHEEFLWNVRRDTRVNGILTNTMSYEDTVGVLKSKGYIWENVQGEEVAKMDFLGSFKALNEENKLKGGKGDKLTADQVNYHEFTKGWKHELEHTDDIEKAKEIALDHLEEDPNYYTRLDMIEYQAKKAKKEAAPKEVSKTNLKDKENQMTSPKGVKKEKANVGRKKEKAKKVTGVKTMKGGSEAPKTIKEAIGMGPNANYNADTVYMWRKLGSAPSKSKLSSSEFSNKLRDYENNNLDVFGVYDSEEFKKLEQEYKKEQEKKNTDDTINRIVGKYGTPNVDPKNKNNEKSLYTVVSGGKRTNMTLTFDQAEELLRTPGVEVYRATAKTDPNYVPLTKANAPKGELTKYMILKGPGAGSKNPVDLDQKQAEEHIRKHGPNSLEPVNKPSDAAKSTPQNLGSLENKYVVIDTKSKEKGTSFIVGKVHDNMNDARKAAEQDKDYKAIPGKFLRAEKSRYEISEDVTNEELNKADEKAMKSEGIKDKSSSSDDVNKEVQFTIHTDYVLNDENGDIPKDSSGKPVKNIGFLSADSAEKRKSELEKQGIKTKLVRDIDQLSNMTAKVKSVKFDKTKERLTIKLDNGADVIFVKTANGKVKGIYTIGRDHANISSTGKQLDAMINKAFGKADPQQQPAEEPMNEALVNYIRQRIRKILKEGYNEEGQYPGVAGPDVVKKKLHHIMQTYDWGFQDSKDPFVRDNGNQKNSLATKLIFDLGPDGEGIIIFNSYAPKGFEISSIDDLGGYTGAVNGGMPQDREFNPDKLTARGGRVAEEDNSRTSMAIKKIAKDAKDLPSMIKKFMNNEYKDGIEKEAVVKLINQMFAKGNLEKSLPPDVSITSLIDKLPNRK